MAAIRSVRLVGWLLLAFAMLAVPGRSFAQGIAVSITIAPPVLPVYAQSMAISGRQDIGLGAIATIIGFPAPGSWRLSLGSYGRRDIGVGTTVPMPGTVATGENISASTVALTMDSDTAALASGADTGKAEASSTTPRS